MREVRAGSERRGARQSRGAGPCNRQLERVREVRWWGVGAVLAVAAAMLAGALAPGSDAALMLSSFQCCSDVGLLVERGAVVAAGGVIVAAPAAAVPVVELLAPCAHDRSPVGCSCMHPHEGSSGQEWM